MLFQKGFFMARCRNKEWMTCRPCCNSAGWYRIFRREAGPRDLSVTYEPNGGTGSFADSNVPEGSQYTVKQREATGITRAGFTFTGWNTEAGGGGTAYQPGDDITMVGDVTLYAQWTEQPGG